MNDIIPELSTEQQPEDWQVALKKVFTNPVDLLTYLNVSLTSLPWAIDPHFPLRVPLSFAQRMKKGDPHDPLLQQVLSVESEQQSSVGFSCDPLQEKHYNPLPGLLHKYESRVLLTFAPSCAVHCRYCFRRHFPYDSNNPGRKGWKPLLEYIEARPSIVEVILSGGDPLVAPNAYLAAFLNELVQIPHVKLLRFHTRFPVVIPQRMDNSLATLLGSYRFKTTMVYHINHPQEIVPAIAEGVTLLRLQGITVLNQSVLLKGINDNIACLTQLSLDLYNAGILPYYVHLLDPVAGTQHFDVPLSYAKELASTLPQHLPGYLVPAFVREIAGEKNKVPILNTDST